MFEKEKKLIEGMSLLTFPFLSKYNVFCAFTSRTGGYSKKPFDSLNLAYHVGEDRDLVRRNRQLVLKNNLNIKAEYIYSVRQVHGSNIVSIDKDIRHTDGAIPEDADCLMTCLKNKPVMVMGADCALILIADIGKRAVCAVHAGWKGTFNKILGKSLEVFCSRFDSKEKEIHIFFGPCIRGCCYNIDNRLADKFRNRFGEGKYLFDRGETPFLDIVELNMVQLRDFDIPEDNIYDSRICTGCDRKYYSYRREGLTGRHGAIAAIF
ncbi:MAG TPA: peptidoglycan editing factor PgeF [Actinobacteria bacterium]|nr:peptidoglycan editing factor PgeF [Actinomycetota bacterium]